MVTKWGLSEKLGPLTFGEDEGEVFLGHSVSRHKEVSESTSGLIDAEVYSIINKNYKRAEQILKDNIEKLHTMAKSLIKFETIGQEQIEDIMQERPIREPAGWQDILNPVAVKQDSENASSPSSNGNEGLSSTHDERAN
jgi:cell division protease FtsH